LRALLNLESAIGLLFLLRVLLRSGKPAPAEQNPRRWQAAAAGLLLLTLAVFWRTLRFPLYGDDYRVIAIFTAPHVPAFVYDYTPAIFFRPLAFLFFRLEVLWAGSQPVRWHLVSVLGHLLNGWLVYRLGALLFGRREIGFWAAAVFAWHGSLAEVVAWPVLVFDLMATGLALAALLLFLRGRLLLALVCEAAAVLSKESAYCLPALVLLVILWRAPSRWRQAIPFAAVAAAIFAWRWRVLGSVGGYIEHAGETLEITHLSLLGVVKVLVLRIWALLWFPVNWTLPLTWILAAALALGVLGMALASATRALRRDLLFGLGFIIIACLPALTRLLVGIDLMGTRYLYLPLVGFALLVAVALAGIESPRARLAAGAALLAFHLVALETNLSIWGVVGNQARRACQIAAAQIGPQENEITVAGAPYYLYGVQFLVTGFPECIAQLGRPKARVRMVPEGRPDATFAWDKTRQQLIRQRLPSLPESGEMRLPPGLVELAAEMRIPPRAHDLEIQGDPAGTLLRMAGGFRGRALWVCEGGRRIRFRGFTIEGHVAGLPAGILAEGTQGLEITGMEFREIAGDGIAITAAHDAAAHRPRAGIDLAPGAPPGNVIQDNQLLGWPASACVMADSASLRANTIARNTCADHK
jgi:hypothetical protein